MHEEGERLNTQSLKYGILLSKYLRSFSRDQATALILESDLPQTLCIVRKLEMLVHIPVLALLTNFVGRSSVSIHGPANAFYIFDVAQPFKSSLARRIVKIVRVRRKLEAFALPVMFRFRETCEVQP